MLHTLALFLSLAVTASKDSAAAPPPSPVSAPATSPAPAPKPDAAVPFAVAASNGFGIDLFKALVRSNPEGNLFLSPHSMSIALTMAAEGARAETEKEMAAVLHFPTKGQRGDRAVTAVHSGFAALAKQLTEAQGNSDPKVDAKIAELRARLDAANKATRDSERSSDRWQEAWKSQQEAQRLANELNGLLATVDRFDLRIANALWVEKTYPLSPDYTAALDRFYGSGAANALDIVNETERARRRINDWVEEHTENRIRELIPIGALTGVTRLVITNAIYFRGEWTMPFLESNTRNEKFTTPDGNVLDVRMMNDSWRGNGLYAAFTGAGEFFDTPMQVPADETMQPPCYPDDAGFQVFQLPYKGGDLAMAFLLPRTAQGLPALEAKLDSGALDSWLGRLASRVVDTGIPRFKMEFEAEMSRPLIELGMRRAFVSPELPGGAQFPGMTSSTDLLQQLFISAVIHKSWIEVAEKGTEAAAATAVMMAPAGAAAPPPPKMVPFIPQFRADRPFLFVIRDVKSGAILFIGRVTNPA